jgi:hypothetical protein
LRHFRLGEGIFLQSFVLRHFSIVQKNEGLEPELATHVSWGSNLSRTSERNEARTELTPQAWRVTEVNSIDTEVHLHLFAAMPATPAEALSRSGLSNTAFLGKVEAIDSAAGSAEVKADWFIEDPTKPQLKPTRYSDGTP